MNQALSHTARLSRPLTVVVGGARVLLGFTLITAVLLRVFVPERGPSFPLAAHELLNAMQGSYLMPFVYATEFLVGLALIFGRFVPLALLVFAPVHLNIILFHLFLDVQPARIIQIVVMLSCHLFLVWTNWSSIKPLLEFRSSAKSTRVTIIFRSLLGLLVLVAGGAKLIQPFETLDYGNGQFLMTALHESGYLFTLLAITEVVAGLALLSGFFIPLTLVILAPITLNIVAFHLFLEPSLRGLLISSFILAISLYLAWVYRSHYQKVLRP